MSEGQLNWVPLDASKLKNVGGDSPRVKSLRVFGLDGKLFPRVVLTVWDSPLNDGWEITASRKENPKAGWNECGIPYNLLHVLPEMVAEALGSDQS